MLNALPIQIEYAGIIGTAALKVHSHYKLLPRVNNSREENTMLIDVFRDIVLITINKFTLHIITF